MAKISGQQNRDNRCVANLPCLMWRIFWQPLHCTPNTFGLYLELAHLFVKIWYRTLVGYLKQETMDSKVSLTFLVFESSCHLSRVVLKRKRMQMNANEHKRKANESQLK